MTGGQAVEAADLGLGNPKLKILLNDYRLKAGRFVCD
jgi:hypothetical protein